MFRRSTRSGVENVMFSTPEHSLFTSSSVFPGLWPLNSPLFWSFLSGVVVSRRVEELDYGTGATWRSVIIQRGGGFWVILQWPHCLEWRYRWDADQLPVGCFLPLFFLHHIHTCVWATGHQSRVKPKTAGIGCSPPTSLSDRKWMDG